MHRILTPLLLFVTLACGANDAPRTTADLDPANERRATPEATRATGPLGDCAADLCAAQYAACDEACRSISRCMETANEHAQPACVAAQPDASISAEEALFVCYFDACYGEE